MARDFTRLTLSELIASRGGVVVRETLERGSSGSWERAYHVALNLQPAAERISGVFGLNLEDIATVVSTSFIPILSKTMKMELKRSNADGMCSIEVLGGESSDFIYEAVSSEKKKKKKSKEHDDDDGTAGEEDGVSASIFGYKKEITSYGDMYDEDKQIVEEQNRMDIQDEFAFLRQFFSLVTLG